MRTFEELLQNASRVIVRKAHPDGSHDPSIAKDRSGKQAKKPQYVAELDGDQTTVTREQGLQLIDKGAADKGGLTRLP